MKNSIRRLADSVTIDGIRYDINTDFLVWIEIERLFFDKAEADCIRLAKILTLAYSVLPPNPFEAVRKIVWFYSGGEYDEDAVKESAPMFPYYNLTEDFDYVWGAFMAEYRIDLTQCSMHWWKFRALMGCLGDECKFAKIVAYRSMDISSIKDENIRRFYAKMKKRFRLSTNSDDTIKEALVADSLEGFF